MKLAIVLHKLFPTFIGGTERQSRILAYTLARLGVDVDVICAEVPPGDDPQALPFRIVPTGWTGGRLVPNLVSEFLFSRRAARLIARGSYDVAYGQAIALWQYLRRADRVPCVMSPYGMEPLKMSGRWPWLRGSVRRRAWHYTAQRSDLIVSSGGKLTCEAQQLMGADPSRIVEIPIGVDVADMDRLLGMVGVVPKVPGTYLCVGRLEFNKGQDLLIEAFRLLQHELPGHLYIVGSGSLRAALARTAPSNVTLLGHQSDEDLVRWYQRAEALILPSRFEALGAVILEAMACRLPIIATDIGAVSTVVDAENGLLVEPGSASALAAAVRAFASLSAEAKTTMGLRSRERVESKFGWDVVGRRTLAVLDRLVQTSTNRAGSVSEGVLGIP